MKNFLFLFFLISAGVYGQITGLMTGEVRDKNTQEPLIGVVLKFTGADTLYTTTDANGKFSFRLPVGKYNIETSYVGYRAFTLFNSNLTSGNAQVLEIELEEENRVLGEVVVSAGKSARATDAVTPLSTQRLTSEEIKVNPGGNFDVSKVIQVLPGVAGGITPNRNDIIVRGGGPSENVYYLDGIEIPVLNHFQTQGASGGATGILNVSFIQDVQLSSSAFDSRYSNALASTIAIRQRNGNPNQLSGNVRLSGTEFATMLEGPLGRKTTFMASGRRSYLQYLFKLLDLPIRPDYYDFQYKINHKIDGQNELNLIGVGAIDRFTLATPKQSDANTAYITRANPLIRQWNYTVGATWKRLLEDGYLTAALSRNMFFNGAERFEDNAMRSGAKLFSLGSHEAENKLRLEINKYTNGWKYSYGADVQYVRYDASIFNTLRGAVTDSSGHVVTPAVRFSGSTAIDFFKGGAYAQAARYFFGERLSLAGGIRSDMNSFTENGQNPLNTLSPRASVSFAAGQKWNISASAGSYFKLPAYTILGYRDASGLLVNQNQRYTRSVHYTIGTEFLPRNDLRVTLEAFFKQYLNYPVSLNTGISFANVGTDFAAVGGERYVTDGKGRVSGVEAYIQQKLVKNMFYVASATLYKSEFTGIDGKYSPSTWDYGFVFSSTLGYKFKGNWDAGVKYRVAGGQPYTPFDLAASRAMYLTTGSGTYDYSRLNTARLRTFQQLDVRVDKKFNFTNTSLNLFVDFQNLLLYKTPSLPKYTFERNEAGFITSDGLPVRTDGSNAYPLILEQQSATTVPSLGFIFEF